MQIVVPQADWGDGLQTDIERLLADVASHITRWLRVPVEGVIFVLPGSGESVPMTYYRGNRGGPFAVQLTARDGKWSQFAYQFSHEFCHILSGHERLRDNPNQWFHESLCELASVFTLRQMAQQWLTCPPFPNWVDYAVSLDQYADELVSRQERQSPSDETLALWLVSEEESLRRDPYQRANNAVVSYSLLPIFEGEPTGWNAVRSLPDSSAGLEDYLHCWSSQVDSVDKPFVNRIIQLFEG